MNSVPSSSRNRLSGHTSPLHCTVAYNSCQAMTYTYDGVEAAEMGSVVFESESEDNM